MNYAIEVSGVTKYLGKREILNSISFYVEPGDIFGYLGPNGAGKTTTIRVILGLFKPDSGRVTILGNDVMTDKSREKLGFVLEADGLYDNLTAEENLDVYCQIYGIPAATRNKKITEVLEIVELSGRAREKIASYSKGMRQKLALARAIIHEPDILVLDEPTAGIDPSGQIEVRNIILNMARHQGKTIFLSSHNLDEVQRICNRIALIDKGAIKLFGELEKLRGENAQKEIVIETALAPDDLKLKILDSVIPDIQVLPFVKNCRRENNKLYLGIDPSADISRIVALLSSRGINIEQIVKSETSLEEIYTRTVGDVEK
jgi:ABC-2 type transport system ATP-binding protein